MTDDTAAPRSDAASAPESIEAIGLTMSGGGYRAAGFHLGALAYLHHVGLGGALRQISTVSGGTFVGASYVLSLVEGHDFDSWFESFYTFIAETDLVGRGLAKLSSGGAKTPSGRQDLIMSMAQVYAETHYCDSKGQPYRLGAIMDADIQLTDAVFNVTEFRHGLAFRFQRARESALIGNGRVHLDRDDARKVRVADIVAASSCFPGGFEPLAFPDDFAWPGGEVPAGVREALAAPDASDNVALMDGGIFDNQGIDSLLVGGKKRRGPVDLFIISDVDAGADELYPFPESKDDGRGLTLGGVRNLLYLAAALCFGSVVVLGVGLLRALQREGLELLPLFAYVVPFILALLVLSGIVWARNKVVNTILPLVPHVGRAAWDDLKRLRVDQLIDMLNLRLSSLLTLTSTVFMNRVRSLTYAEIYGDRAYQKVRVSNMIRELHLADDDPWRLRLGSEVEAPSRALRAVGRDAATMATTLWFESPEQLPTLVASGQATLCLNLIKWVRGVHGDDTTSYPPKIAELWSKLVRDWKLLNADPQALVGIQRAKIGVAQPTPPSG